MSGGEVARRGAAVASAWPLPSSTLDKRDVSLCVPSCLTPLPRTDRPLRRVIGWFDTLDLPTSHARALQLSGCPAVVGPHLTTTSIGVPPPASGLIYDRTLSVAGCPRAPMPPRTSGALRQQASPISRSAPTAALASNRVTMRQPPAATVPDTSCTPVTICHQDAGDCSQQLASYLPPTGHPHQNTVTRLVTATHSQARLAPWRQLVSSRWATACAWT